MNVVSEQDHAYQCFGGIFYLVLLIQRHQNVKSHEMLPNVKVVQIITTALESILKAYCSPAVDKPRTTSE
jgi:hypothetical protein